MSSDPKPVTNESSLSNPKPKVRKNTHSYKTILSGGFAGMISKTCTAPLERVQMLNQTGATQASIMSTLKKIWIEDKIRGLWKGNVANCIRVFPHKTILFAFNEALLQYFPANHTSYAFLTGAVSGLVATTATYPLDVIRAMLSGTFDKNTTMRAVFKLITRDKGLLGLYTGLSVTCIGAVPYEATRIGVYNVLRPYIPATPTKFGNEPHPIGKMLTGAFAGACAGFVTYPTDTIRRMLQVQSADGMPRYKGVMDCIISTLKRKGITRFYRGLTAKLVRVVPDAAILFVAYESLKDYFED